MANRTSCDTSPLVLAVIVGNSTTRVGLCSPAESMGTYECTTPFRLTVDEACAHIAQAVAYIQRTHPDTFDTIEATSLSSDASEICPSALHMPHESILACVVPALSDTWTRALLRICGAQPYRVGPGLKTGIHLRYDNPAQLGADRVANIVGAHDLVGAPAIVVDVGTTTTIEVLDEHASFLGGCIAPGLEVGAQALSAAAARLPFVDIHAPASVIGTNTTTAMQSGIVWGEIARIDGLLDAVCREMGSSAPCIMTGHYAGQLAALLAHEVHVIDDLTLHGLSCLWQRNRRA